MPLKDGSPEDYGGSAVRHFKDADLLRQGGRLDNAGHLIGFAAECAIKHRIEALGTDERSPDLHLPHILPAARKRLGERVGYRSMYEIIRQDIFKGWSVDHRYAQDGRVQNDVLEEWFAITKRLFAAANIRVRLP